MKKELNKVNIEVKGIVCSGKSSIANLIKNALTEKGIKASISDIDGSDKRKVISTLDKRLLTLKEKGTEVVIEVK